MLGTSAVEKCCADVLEKLADGCCGEVLGTNDVEKCWRHAFGLESREVLGVLWRRVGEECCREEGCREGLEKIVAEKCCRDE